jgi:hypothetical protein
MCVPYRLSRPYAGAKISQQVIEVAIVQPVWAIHHPRLLSIVNPSGSL